MKLNELLRENKWSFDDIRQMIGKEKYERDMQTALYAARKLDSYQALVDFIPESKTGKYKSSGNELVFGPLPVRGIGFSQGRDYYWRTSPGEGIQKLNQAYASTSWTKKWKTFININDQDPLDVYAAALKSYDSAFKEILQAAKFEIKLRNDILGSENDT